MSCTSDIISCAQETWNVSSCARDNFSQFFLLAIFTINIYNMPFCTCHTENDGIAPLNTGTLWQNTDSPFQLWGTMTWMLYRVLLGQVALNPTEQELVMHIPFFDSITQKLSVSDSILKVKTIGLESNSHSNVTGWFTATSLDGWTFKVISPERYEKK